MKVKLSRKKKVVFSTITFLLAFGFLNAVAWLISPKDSVFWENPLMMMYPVDKFDENVTFEHYNFNNDPNRPVRYVPHRQRWYRLDPEPLIPEDGQLVLNFGDSSTWGWGLSDRGTAYPLVLDKSLPDGVHSINLGVPGYSSLQGLRYMEELLPKYRQRVVGVTIYFGNNDSTENGSADADRLEKKTSTWVKTVRWFPLGRVLYYGAAKLNQKSNQKPRVNPEEYESNLRQMIALVQSYNIPVILVEPPRHLSWRPAHLTYVTSLQPQVRNNWVTDELEKASQKYAEGRAYITQRNDQCLGLFREALDYDWVIPRIKTDWLQRLSSLSGINGVTYIRLGDPFIEAEYPYAFVDYCHPSTHVHDQIAGKVKTALGF